VLLRFHAKLKAATKDGPGGLLGQLRLSGPGVAPLWPLIALGQWLNLGKNTSFGLGRYRVVAASSTTRCIPASLPARRSRPSRCILAPVVDAGRGSRGQGEGRRDATDDANTDSNSALGVISQARIR
jgi:hypothetical protein